MGRTKIVAYFVVALALPTAAIADLQENLFNLNGTLYHNDFGVPGLNSAGFDYTTGLGTLTLTYNPGLVGAYYFTAFFDHQLHAPFYNEYGSVGGAPGAGISWQIDEPGFGDANRLGTIFTNASNNTLDNTNHIPGSLSNFSNDCGANGGGAVVPACNNDVSMALGFNFIILAADEYAIITLDASTTQPASGFYLGQHDPDTSTNVYLTGAISIQPTAVPEPGSWELLGAVGLILGCVLRRRISA